MNLNLNQIPANIDTVEKLVAWGSLLLHFANTTLKIKEAENYSDFACQSSIFTAEDGTNRLVTRTNFELDPLFDSNGQKLFLNVKEFTEQTIPASYL